jgi:hypothetical protein
MTALANRTWTILGEQFEFDELKDIANYGADTGVHGFTYSTDLHDIYEEYTDEIDDRIESLGYTMAEVFEQRGFDTLQQYKEWACWAYLETEAAAITDY